MKTNNNKGFSLVELMVVVAIIGILATMAVPQVNKFMAKARQSEAKTNLTMIYTSEKAFFAEYNGYHSAFQAIGYGPEGRLRYRTGFGAQIAAGQLTTNYNGSVAIGASFDTGTNAAAGYCGAGAFNGNGCSMMSESTASGALTAGNVAALGTFTAEARSRLINTSALNDVWTINQNKNITQTANGID